MSESNEIKHLRGLEQDTYDTWKITYGRLHVEYEALAAENAKLREAIQDLPDGGKWDEYTGSVTYTEDEWPAIVDARKLLATTPPAALQELRDGVIEECAKVADEYPVRDPAEDGNGYWAAEEIAAALLAMKGKADDR